ACARRGLAAGSAGWRATSASRTATSAGDNRLEGTPPAQPSAKQPAHAAARRKHTYCRWRRLGPHESKALLPVWGMVRAQARPLDPSKLHIPARTAVTLART